MAFLEAFKKITVFSNVLFTTFLFLSPVLYCVYVPIKNVVEFQSFKLSEYKEDKDASSTNWKEVMLTAFKHCKDYKILRTKCSSDLMF